MTAVTTPDYPCISSARRWAGWIMTGIAGLFLLMNGSMQLIKPELVVRMTTDLGHPESLITPLGIVPITATSRYLIPSTALLGTVLLCGYLGELSPHMSEQKPVLVKSSFPQSSARPSGAVFVFATPVSVRCFSAPDENSSPARPKDFAYPVQTDF